MTPDITELSTAQLKKIIVIREKIEALQNEMAAIIGSSKATTAEAAKPKTKKFSAAARRKMAISQKARWAKTKESSPVVEKAVKVVKKLKRIMSAATKAKISASQQAKWAKIRATKSKG